VAAVAMTFFYPMCVGPHDQSGLFLRVTSIRRAARRYQKHVCFPTITDLGYRQRRTRSVLIDPLLPSSILRSGHSRALLFAPSGTLVLISSARPRSLAWVGGRLSPSRCFRLRRRTDRHHRTRAPTHPLQAASRASPGPVPFQDRPASRRSRRLPKCRARVRRRSR
jgi:hypothetical protein